MHTDGCFYFSPSSTVSSLPCTNCSIMKKIIDSRWTSKYLFCRVHSLAGVGVCRARGRLFYGGIGQRSLITRLYPGDKWIELKCPVWPAKTNPSPSTSTKSSVTRKYIVILRDRISRSKLPLGRYLIRNRRIFDRTKFPSRLVTLSVSWLCSTDWTIRILLVETKWVTREA